MNKLIVILALAAAPTLSVWSAPLGKSLIDTPKNAPILDCRMECLFEAGRLGEVVRQPEKSSVDLLMERLIFEKAHPIRSMCDQPEAKKPQQPQQPKQLPQ